MRVMGLDLSLTSSGFCLGVDGQYERSGIVLGERSGIPRMITGREKVMRKIEETKPHLVLIEDLAWSMNKSYAKENAGFSFALQMEFVTDGIPYCVISSSSLKKFCCGTAGNPKAPIKKERILKDLLSHFGHNIDSNDEADAIVLAYIGMAAVGDWKMKNEPQRQSLETIHKTNPWIKVMAMRASEPKETAPGVPFHPMLGDTVIQRVLRKFDVGRESSEEADATLPDPHMNGW